MRGETETQHRPLTELPATLGDWRQKGSEIKFDASVEGVLRTSNYTMREYTLPDGRIANLYVATTPRSGAGGRITAPIWAVTNDERTTHVGKVVRKLRIDEIPQFWNILMGEMNFVGPRPERPHFVEQLAKDIPYFEHRHLSLRV